MQSRSYGRFVSVVIGVLILSVIVSALFSLAQPGLSISVLALPQMPTFPKVAHPACPDCFTYVCPECYMIFEEVPGTGVILTREIPNPAPLEPDERRLEFDVETGLPIWYIGRQPYVGPTDEQPFSSEFPTPKIVLKRIQARHSREVFSIPGVHGFGISAKGLMVLLDPKQPESEAFISKELEGVPVEVQPGGPFTSLSHQATIYRPVPTSASVGANRPDVGAISGTSGPHIVLNSPTRIWTLTAGHVVKIPSENPPTGRQVNQPGPNFSGSTFWGVVSHSFRQAPCAHPPNCTGDPANFSSVTPDIAAIAHINLSHTDPYPHTSPAGSAEPIRKMYYGRTSSVNGPSGIVQLPSNGTVIKWWGAYSDAPKGPVFATNVVTVVQDPSGSYKYSAMDFADLERGAIPGDSGSLVAGDGVSNRHVFGIAICRDQTFFDIVCFHTATDVQAALQNAGLPFDHFWGTASGRSDLWFPAATQCDGSC